MSAKHQTYGSPGPDAPPGPAKVIRPPRWRQLALLIEGTKIRQPARLGGNPLTWPKPGLYQIGGRYKGLVTGEERNCLLEVDEWSLGRAEELFSLFLMTAGDSPAVEERLRAITRTVNNDEVSRAHIDEVEKALTLLLGMDFPDAAPERAGVER